MKRNLRQRTHDFKRTELASLAFDLMVEHGYDALTVEDLAKATGVSRATFFRYLGSKDEVAVAALVEPTDTFAIAFADTESGQNRWQRLRAAFEPLVLKCEADPNRFLSRIRLIQQHKDLGDRLRRARAAQVDSLAEAMIADGIDDLEAQVFAAAAVAISDRCVLRWARAGSEPLRAMMDRAFRLLGAP